MTDTTSLKDGEAHPAALIALQYLNALDFEEKQDFLLTFSSLALEGNRLAEICYGTLRRIIDRQPISDRYVLGLAWEINRMKTPQAPPVVHNSPLMRSSVKDFFRL